MPCLHVTAAHFALLLIPLVVAGIVAAVVFASNVDVTSPECSDFQVDTFRQHWKHCLENETTNALCANQECLADDFIAQLPDCHIGASMSLREAMQDVHRSCQVYQIPVSCSDQDLRKLHESDSQDACACDSNTAEDGCSSHGIRLFGVAGYCKDPVCSLFMVRLVDKQPSCTQPLMSLDLAMCVSADQSAATRLAPMNFSATTVGSSVGNSLPKSEQQRYHWPRMSILTVVGIVVSVAAVALFVGSRYQKFFNHQPRRRHADSVAETVSSSCDCDDANDSLIDGAAPV